ncbi:MAG TPA: prepilin-type N-terminal cleavage/methylation domain-containing protein [Blastocatellia bacterium]|nr:prepilin-type N-terminal cleavage/methylation domain-containing protein [Blastocatellia bacterium]
MKRGSQQGFTILELMVSSATLLILLGAALSFFARSQVVYTGERATLDMVQDMRTVFDRFTNEIRMAGSGLPAPRGVIQGTTTSLIVRGDFSQTTTIITSTGSITISGSSATFPVGTTSGFAVGQTISLLNNTTGGAALVKITAVDTTNSTLTVDSSDLLPLTSGAAITDFTAGAIINVIERRTYAIITSGDNKGAITRTVAYEDTQTAGNTIQATEIIARNVLDADGNPGMSFTYYQADGTSALVGGVLNPDVTKKVQVLLQARSARPDPQTGNYRTFIYTALVQVRGQYAPSVGY